MPVVTIEDPVVVPGSSTADPDAGPSLIQQSPETQRQEILDIFNRLLQKIEKNVHVQLLPPSTGLAGGKRTNAERVATSSKGQLIGGTGLEADHTAVIEVMLRTPKESLVTFQL